MSNNCKILGVTFFNGSIKESLRLSKLGGLVVAPSGPGLACDLTRCDVYEKSLLEACLVLPDSGLMCLFQNWFKNQKITRISGLNFLKYYLENYNINESFFWIMPNKSQDKTNRSWLLKNHGFEIEEHESYCAPLYDESGTIQDSVLLSMITKVKPKTIFIQLGGGVQERLGMFLKENLEYKPTILCTGAALAFLSGEQVHIPKWADQLYLGWLFRCFFNPRLYMPRYAKAFRLIFLLVKYGERSPNR